MTHGDDRGLILPPRVAPLQVICIPIIISKDDPNIILSKLKDINTKLKNMNIRTKIDEDDVHTPGWKFANWEMKGVPVRIELGMKDIKNEKATIFCRDNQERHIVDIIEVPLFVEKLLETIQSRMFFKAQAEMLKKTKEADNFDAFLNYLNEKCMVLTPWCNIQSCEENVKLKVKAESEKHGLDESHVGTVKTLCIPTKQPQIVENTKCFICDKNATVQVLWGRSY